MTDLATGSVEHAGPPRVALLESSHGYRAALAAVAQDEGWTATMHASFPELLAAVETTGVELIVLSYRDVPAPDLAFGRLRSAFEGPLVVLAEDGAELKAALRSGATLALGKPFDPEYLVLAIEAVLQRSISLRSMLAGGATVGDLWVRLANHTVERAGRRQVLGPGEWQLFAFLLANPGRTFSRDDLARGAWGAGYRGRVSQVELYISRLRRKVELNPHKPEVIMTVRREGYRLIASAAAPSQAPDAPLVDGVASGDQPAARWYLTSAYREIINVATRLVEHSRAAVDAAGAGDRREIRVNDLPLIEVTVSRARARLLHWEKPSR
ncbi:MAG TPA: response regulator transcription factor [Candidatus Dormibacteraeota bacterium]|jgi:two-component system response regulator MtrA|nr:response regulator transcription factor [Candidatus Dormibacteraeota bacterium]